MCFLPSCLPRLFAEDLGRSSDLTMNATGLSDLHAGRHQGLIRCTSYIATTEHNYKQQQANTALHIASNGTVVSFAPIQQSMAILQCSGEPKASFRLDLGGDDCHACCTPFMAWEGGIALEKPASHRKQDHYIAI